MENIRHGRKLFPTCVLQDPPPPPCSALIRTRAGPLPQEGPKGVHGWHQSRPRPTQEAYLGFLTSVILVCSPNSRFRNPSRGPDRRAESPRKPHPSCKVHYACRPWTCLGTSRAEVGRRCKGCPDRGPGHRDLVGGSTTEPRLLGPSSATSHRQKSPSAAPQLGT